MNNSTLYTGIVCLLLGMTSCKKDAEAPEAPPVSDLRTYDMVPVTVERIPSGYLLECKRALSDPQAAYAQLLDTDGDPVSRIDFNNLTTTIENITFDRQDITITNVLPWDGSTYLLCGFAIETQHEHRIHAVVYNVDANGAERSDPIRRFIGSGAELLRNNDLNELYRTRVLAAKSTAGDLILAARYETEASARILLMRIPMSTGSLAVTAEVPLSALEHRLQFLKVRPGSDQVLVGMDVASGNEPTVLGISTWSIAEDGLTPGPAGQVGLRKATATAVEEADGTLRITGMYDSGFDEPRTFHGSGPDPGNLSIASVQNEGGHAGISYASQWANGAHHSTLNLFESAVLGPEAERNDRISDLKLGKLSSNGEWSDLETIIPGQGARAIGCYQTATGTVIIGALHPFLNTDYLHTFFVKVQPE